MGCIPGSVSFSRSALNHYAGAQSIYAGVFNAAFIAGAVFAFREGAQYIPLASLAAVLIVASSGLGDWRYLLRLVRADRAEALVSGVTLLATLTLPLTYAISAGVLLNLAIYLRRASHLHLEEMLSTADGRFLERPVPPETADHRVALVQLEGELFFGVADELERRLDSFLNSPVTVLLLRLKRVHNIDTTVSNVIDRFARRMHEKGRHVLLCGVRPDLMKTLARHGLLRSIPADDVFITEEGVFVSAQRALARAYQLLSESHGQRTLTAHARSGL
jgi:SulP family sulfate permease